MRKKKGIFRRFHVCALVGSIIVSNITPALAYTDSVGAVTETQTVTQAGSAETTVYAELGNDFKVTIPKSLTLDGKTKTGSYTVDVEGDIAGADIIKVVPEESFTLSSTGLIDVTASITQDKTEWSCNEILAGDKIIGNGSINASGISAGEWEGTFWFNINLEEGSGGDSGSDETQHTLTLSDYNVAMGTEDAVQVTAYLDGKEVNESVTWTSDNEDIIVTNGLVETKASAEVGDTATVTVTAENPEELSAMANVLSDLGIVTFASAGDDLSATFTVTIIDMAYTTSGEDEVITSLDLKAGESKDVEVTIIPASATGIVKWSTTAPAGINLVKNGNTVTIKIADDMETGKSYDLVATYGNFSKLLTINIAGEEEHIHDYTETVTKEATCTEEGEKKFTCDCGESYTTEIPKTDHTFENGSCTDCGTEDPDHEHDYTETVTKEATCTEVGEKKFTCDCGESYTTEIPKTEHNYENGSCTDCGEEKALEAGLYDANGVMLASWEEAGIDVETNYISTSSGTATILANTYPTAVKVVIPEGITRIGNYAFYNCKNLTSVEIPSSVTSIGEWAFSFCTSLTSIGTTGSGASVEIPDGVTSIERSTFSNCTNLSDIELSSDVTSIEQGAFAGCNNVSNIKVDENNTNYCSIDNIIFSEDMQTIVFYAPRKISSSYTIPEGITRIEDYAFCGSQNLTSVEIPDSVTSIGEAAFHYTGLTSIGAIGSGASVEIPDGVTSIERSTFSYCHNLSNVTIPDSVTKIGGSAFTSCENLSSVIIGSGVTSIGSNAFYNCTNLTSATFKITSGWYYGYSTGDKSYSISSSSLANKSTAATYLTSTYAIRYWTR